MQSLELFCQKLDRHLYLAPLKNNHQMHPDWKENATALSRDYAFKDFSQALAFIVKVGLLAEKQNHHPEIRNVYNRVWLKLYTHDAGNTVTEKDHKLARAIDALEG